MVKMIPDRTGRFPRRPHYAQEELDFECEQIIDKFLRLRHGRVRLPVDTDEIRILIESHDAELDSYADLSAFGTDVEGMAEFFADSGPKVSICKTLANDDRRQNRLRTTLAHEFGHVHFHGPLWSERFKEGRLFDRRCNDDARAVCKRGDILNASQADWMEWQAGYVSGALLMPVTVVRRLVSDYCAPLGLHGAIHVESDHAEALMRLVMDRFDVSAEAARVRLVKLHVLTVTIGQRSLFDP